MSGFLIRAERQRRGWSLREFAARTGYSVGYLSNIETDKARDCAVALFVIARCLEWNWDDVVPLFPTVFGIDDPPERLEFAASRRRKRRITWSPRTTTDPLT